MSLRGFIVDSVKLWEKDMVSVADFRFPMT